MLISIDKLDKAASRLSEYPFIRAIRKGLVYMMPLILIGSLVLMVLNLPIPAFQNWMLQVFGEEWREVVGAVYTGTFQVMAITELIAVSFAYASEKEIVRSGQVSPLSVVLTVFASYMAFSSQGIGVVGMEHSDSTGMFEALIVACVGTSLFLFLYSRSFIRIKLFTNDSDAILMASLKTLLPALLTILFFSFARSVLHLSGAIRAAQAIYQGLYDIFAQSNGFFTAILFTLITHILWFFGLHGTNMLDGMAQDFFLTASEANIAQAMGGDLPVNILTKEFFDNFVYLGGCGSTLGLLVALLLVSRNANIKKVTKVSLLPGIFNINEMMIYGLPVVFNPYYLIPFLLTPVLLSIVTYGAMWFGLVPLTISRVTWTTPIFISGYVSTGSVAGVALQAVNLILSVLIYIPFIRSSEKHQSENALLVFQRMSQEVGYIQGAGSTPILSRNNEEGLLARELASDLQSALGERRSDIYLAYQPKTDINGKLSGCEALLRWQHPIYGMISPPTVINIAQEAELGNRLGAWILERALVDMHRLEQTVGGGFSLSVNLNPEQLRQDDHFVKMVTDCLERTGLSPERLILELTENAAVDQSWKTRTKLEAIRELGVGLSIDDFGMGHSSLLYIRDFFATEVKIDKSLVDDIASDENSRHIVASIVQLCGQMGVEVIAEGVETEQQAKCLKELGCCRYQGYYFSRPMKLDDFAQYILRHGCIKKLQIDDRLSKEGIL